MLYLSKGQKEQLIEHSLKESPNEACGILAGKHAKVEKVFPVISTDKSSQTFFMDTKEQLRVMKEIRSDGLEMIGIYHSHPQTEAYPSAHDVELAFYPEVSYVIISLKNKEKPNIRSFGIIEGKINEEELKIV